MSIKRALRPTARLYIPSNTGGRGLKSAEKTIRTKAQGLSGYIKVENNKLSRFLTGSIKEKLKEKYKNDIRKKKKRERQGFT